MFSFLRYIKNITPKKLYFFWFFFGQLYRYLIKKLKINFYVKQKISKHGPFKIHCFFAFSNFNQWGLEPNSIFPLMMKKCINKKFIVDIGAHIGLTTLPLSSLVKKNSKLVSFEPSSINREFLQNHLKKNNIKNVKVIDTLVGEKEEKKVPFFESINPTGLNSIIKLKKKELFIKKFKKQVSLDSYFKNNNYKPDLIKIDAEGSEIFILNGSIKTIKKYKPDIFLSIHKKHLIKLGVNENEIFNILKKINYEIKDSRGINVKKLNKKEYYLHSVLKR